MTKNDHKQKSNRQSNIELLRIVAALGVILLHYNNANIGGGFRYVEGGANKIVLAFTQAAFICAVNLFILISGYFMRHSGKRDLLKPIELLVQFLVYETAFMLINIFFNGENIKNAVKYFAPSYWFIFVYIALYLVSPYLNLVWNHLDTGKRKVMLTVMLSVFVIYPQLVDMIAYITGGKSEGITTIGLDGSFAGYSVVQFVIMYFIGLYLRDKDETNESKTGSKGKTAGILFLNILVIMGWSIVDLTVFGKGTALIPAWNYHNPLVITEAVLFFKLFKKMDLGSNKVINSLATASFPAYLVHMNLLGYFGIEKAVQGNAGFLVIHIIGTVMIIYLATYLINSVYLCLTGPLFKMLDKKWHRIRKYEAP